ncbi:hypothetical protein [Hydrogenophaga intermedia]|uniref:hypothetical protein n=1 Tax=Hydrogenophaga intermedia TaxID=65786 RepID=UPI002043D512|nr:hypothetical protein [Hydrogenophaga intermedia]
MTNRIGDSLHHFGPNKDLVRALIDHQVQFVLVGGLAVSWFCPRRTADDMDLLVAPTVENSGRVAAALQAISHPVEAPDAFARPGLQVRLGPVLYAELLTPRTDAPSFNEVASRAVEGKLFDMPIKIAAPGDLMAMKQLVIDQGDGDLQKHREDIAMLRNV